MANGRSNSQNRNRRPSGSTRKGNGRSSTSARRSPAKKKAPEQTPFEAFRARFFSSRFFRPVLTVVVITLLILLDLLFSWNDFNRFFIILGVELIIAAIIWVIALGFNLGSDIESSGDTDDGA